MMVTQWYLCTSRRGPLGRSKYASVRRRARVVQHCNLFSVSRKVQIMYNIHAEKHLNIFSPKLVCRSALVLVLREPHCPNLPCTQHNHLINFSLGENLLAMFLWHKLFPNKNKWKLIANIAIIYLLSKHVVYLAQGTLILQEQACKYLSAILKQETFVFNCVWWWTNIVKVNALLEHIKEVDDKATNISRILAVKSLQGEIMSNSKIQPEYNQKEQWDKI